jgi:hypothetical protein
MPIVSESGAAVKTGCRYVVDTSERLLNEENEHMV